MKNKIRKNIGRLIMIIKSFVCFFTDKYFLAKLEKFKPGTRKWFIATEIKYGGLAINVPRNKVSLKDPRSEKELKTGGMTGGDRMNILCNNYAPMYEQALASFIKKTKPVVLVEVGILKGTGLAIWSDLFKKGRIIGLDIDLGHILKNMKNLKEKGAFQNNNLELYEFDQYKDNKKSLSKILNGDKINILIDDGCHKDEPTMRTFESVLPFLDDDFVYIIEDNNSAYKIIEAKYPEFRIQYNKLLTVVSKN